MCISKKPAKLCGLQRNFIANVHEKMRNMTTLERNKYKLIRNKYHLIGETRDHLAIHCGETDFTV